MRGVVSSAARPAAHGSRLPAKNRRDLRSRLSRQGKEDILPGDRLMDILKGVRSVVFFHGVTKPSLSDFPVCLFLTIDIFAYSYTYSYETIL